MRAAPHKLKGFRNTFTRFPLMLLLAAFGLIYRMYGSNIGSIDGRTGFTHTTRWAPQSLVDLDDSAPSTPATPGKSLATVLVTPPSKPQHSPQIIPFMAPAPSKLYSDDVSLLVVALDTNPFFWGGASSNPNTPSLSFSRFLNHLLPFLNSIILLHQLNQVVVIATGVNSCDYIYDSSSPPMTSAASESRNMPSVCSAVLQNLEDFLIRDRQIGKDELAAGNGSSLLSGSLSLALCYIQRVFRAGPLHPQPRILCLQGSPDGPEQYVAVMNAIFSAQRSMIPIDSCVVGIQHSAFLQQASYITGGVYLKPQHLDGLFQYLSMVFATDLQSRSFLQLPKPVGVDFRASCFCHKKTIDMGYICSVCLSIYCKHHKKCSTCGWN
ncbi:general transcription and DNA repair factor IIH subunit TFB4 isoform X2 [Magnolia sinica]|uniref:general transcription and DNA repair factor IIH subunit TFB4 isoform X2 n=1 Tax=Magnolia sinica TaxID=86752 RepID=UPI002657B9CB|nr:general transcription and DNA repair factor IIH subunit TFB4 isoform X2 [Magnolia sinica]